MRLNRIRVATKYYHLFALYFLQQQIKSANVFLHCDYIAPYLDFSIPFIIYLCHLRTIGILIYAGIGLHPTTYTCL